MNNKKLATAIAAVQLYIKTQEEAALVATQNQAVNVNAAAGHSCVDKVNLWGLSGRQAIMNANAIIRQRMLK